MAKRKTPARGKGGRFVKGSKRKTRSRRRRTAPKEKEMPRRRRRKSSRRAPARRRSSSSAMFSSDTKRMIGSAGYGWLEHKISSDATWSAMWQQVPVIQSIGRAGTFALLMYGLGKWAGVAPRWTIPISHGIADIALGRLGNRGFELYTEPQGRAVISGPDDQPQVLMGDIGDADFDGMGDDDV